MRNLSIEEVEAISGGVAPVVVGVIKAGGAVLGVLAGLGVIAHLGGKAVDAVTDLCKSGSNASLSTPKGTLACTAPPPSKPASSAVNNVNDSTGMGMPKFIEDALLR